MVIKSAQLKKICFKLYLPIISILKKYNVSAVSSAQINFLSFKRQTTYGITVNNLPTENCLLEIDILPL